MERHLTGLPPCVETAPVAAHNGLRLFRCGAVLHARGRACSTLQSLGTSQRMRSDPIRSVCFAREGDHSPERDYRRDEDPRMPHLHGFSQFYSDNCTTPVALAPGCDAHFIPLSITASRTHSLTFPLLGMLTTRPLMSRLVQRKRMRLWLKAVTSASRLQLCTSTPRIH
ncbi:Hypothetical protein, putative [Bodo saltans]|uniref:Uncharacterized protein n=1 Tax=Bodo saltans TaxID=75058 RepID=A0A0S4JKG9_BODSA|nr:Hypothetical protein, putative [Bodo saltans]|eukprot:CUG90882.1 Hypothetical protein, putative [Bodo saltans]